MGSPPHTWRILGDEFGSDPSVQDHLHIRGEYNASPQDLMIQVGSPPHTWRIQPTSDRLWPPPRITSTYVENTDIVSFCFCNKEGSPPHTWRILRLFELIPAVPGITSTYVENTDKTHSPPRAFQDHLHIRGEYSAKPNLTSHSLGSPPHTWRIL